MARTLTANTMSVATDMTDAEAYSVVFLAVQEGRANDFVADLCAAYRKWGSGTTEARLAWLHKYAHAIIEREQGGDYAAFDLNPKRKTGFARRRRF